MSSSTQTTPTRVSPGSRSQYLGSLDGLRFVSFLVIFGNHLPAPAAMAPFANHGWVAVDLFFAISVYLMFRLLDAEWRKDGSINVRNFYARRMLRIYPLLVVYYLITFFAREGFLDPMGWARLATTLTSVDNIASWWWGYNFSIQAVGHLWTLSYEFQIYMFLPLAFLAWKRFGSTRFLLGLLAIEIVAFTVRYVAVGHGAPDVGIYVIPYFRPESILLGMALAVVRPKWHPLFSFLAAFTACFAIFTIADPHRVWAYAASAIVAVGLVDSAVRLRLVRVALSLRPIRYLGTVSYGLYVFHIAAIWTAVRILELPAFNAIIGRTTILVLGLALSLLGASISYKYLERPFLRLKRRFTSVEGRT